MSGKRSKLIRKIALARGPFSGEVEYKETGTHYKYGINDLMSGKGGILVSDPIHLNDRCYRKVVKEVKVQFKRIREEFPLTPNAGIYVHLIGNPQA